jgi:peptidyl-prolyl cis-trans isomerase SurA
VQQELDQRMNYYVSQLGSEEKLEEYMGKSIGQLKEEFREDVRKLLLARQEQAKITGDTKVNPSEVRAFFNSIPADSLPLLNAEVELATITKKPPVNQEEKMRVKGKLEKIRDRIEAGEDFATMSVLYSEDVESAKRGGELGYVGRNDLVPEFSAEAFNLKGKEVSRIVETTFGYHIIQLIGRRGEMINVRHILLIPKTSSADLLKGQQQLDSIKILIQTQKISFDSAAYRYSDDEDTKRNGGRLINPATGTSRFDVTELDPQLFFAVDKLSIGEVSAPIKVSEPGGKVAYRMLKLVSKSAPHRANLKDDYQRVQIICQTQKQNKVINDWIRKKRRTTYVRINAEFSECNFKHPWFEPTTANPKP